MRKLALITVLLLLTAMCCGCSQPPAEPLAQPTPIPTAAPTEEPVATLPIVPAADPNGTAEPTPQARIVLEEKTDENPYPLPRMVAEPFDRTDLTEDMLRALAKRFCYDLFSPAKTLAVCDFSQYAEDNASTHLALRWGEYLMADAKKYPHKRILEFTSIRADGLMRENHDDYVIYNAMCEVRYNRKDPSVNGCNVDITMTVAPREGKLKIVALQLVFDSRYRDLLARLTADAGGADKLTIEQIDAGFTKALKAI